MYILTHVSRERGKIRISDILKMGEERIEMRQKSRHLVNCEIENESSSRKRKGGTVIYRINHQ